MAAVTQGATLSGRPLGLGKHTLEKVLFKPRMPVTARRTVSQRWLNRAKPNWELDEPDRLWEIGSNYWLPFSPYSPPEYLDGSLPGDRGFDPFRLGETWGNPPDGSETPERRIGWLLEGELYNGRVAMLAVVGILVTELQGKGPYWTIPYNLGVSAATFAAGVVGVHLVMALLEKKRLENWTEKGEAGHFGLAPFDPLDLSTDYIRQAEVRNARLAMLSVLGFAVQSWVTGKGPIENAIDHASAPFDNNIFTYGDKGLQVVGVFLAFSVALHLAEVARTKEPSDRLVRRSKTVGGSA